MYRLAVVAVICLGLAACATAPVAPDLAELQRQVAETERAFAGTMAERDRDAFASFLADEAVFVTGTSALRGKQQVADGWRRFFEGDQAPFSWEPQAVEVLATGDLALSSGPVRDPNGTLVATFNSIWRQEAPGVWRVVFDKGTDACPQSEDAASGH